MAEAKKVPGLSVEKRYQLFVLSALVASRHVLSVVPLKLLNRGTQTRSDEGGHWEVQVSD